MPDYYDRLQAVRERGELEEWIQFFLTAVTAQANDAIQRAEDLFNLRERYIAELAGTRSRARELVNLLFENPYVTARLVATRLGVSNQGALNLIRSLESKHWLVPRGTFGKGGRVSWVAPEVFGIIDRPPARRTGEVSAQMELTLPSQ